MFKQYNLTSPLLVDTPITPLIGLSLSKIGFSVKGLGIEIDTHCGSSSVAAGSLSHYIWVQVYRVYVYQFDGLRLRYRFDGFMV